MSADHAFTITYWGVTGTMSAPLRPAELTDKVVAAVTRLIEQGSLNGLQPGPSLDADVRRVVTSALPFHLRSGYGGNTTCVEVQTPDALLILDSGSGFRELGTVLAARWQAEGDRATRRAHILLTHPHMDHTFATPYFVPYYDSRNHFTLWGTQRVIDSITAVLDPHSQLSQIYFPPTFDQLKAIREFRPLEEHAEFRIGGTRITTYALCHPGGCLAYRLENAGKVFVFATDHEQPEVPDRSLAEFARRRPAVHGGPVPSGRVRGQNRPRRRPADVAPRLGSQLDRGVRADRRVRRGARAARRPPRTPPRR